VNNYPLQIGAAKVILKGREYLIEEGETVSGVICNGKAILFNVTGPQETFVRVADVVWDNGENDVRALDAYGPKMVRRLDQGAHRLSVYDHPQNSELAWIELSQARIDLSKHDLRTQRRKADERQLDEGARVKVFQILIRLGAIKVDTKHEVLGTISKRKDFLSVLFPKHNKDVPIASFVLTRILPSIWEYSG
jgi:hypothetical protein